MIFKPPVLGHVHATALTQASGRFEALCQDAPQAYRSANAPAVRDVVGTLVLGVLAGHWRYAHLSALRFDEVTPGLLGLGGLVSEDSLRRGLRQVDQPAGRQWLTGHLRASWWEFLTTPWILHVDTTIKPIYGRQEGARVGYNPQKPGRPSHALHTYWISTVRLCLDVEVHPGNAAAASYGLDGLWALIDQLPKERGRMSSAATVPTATKRACSRPKPTGRVICSKCAAPREPAR